MALLDTFMIMFEADANSVTDGTATAKRNTDKLTDALHKADRAGDMVGSSMKNLIAVAGGALTAILSLGAMKSGIENAANYADALGESADALGLNIEELSVWSDAVVMSGGSAEGFRATLANMTSDFQMIATKGTSRTLPFFKKLGINLKDAHGKMRSVMDVLPELADKFEKMGKAEAMGMAQKMGLDQGTIMLLQQGRRAVEDQIKQQKELGIVTKEQAEISAEYNDALDKMGFAFRSVFLQIGAYVLPAFQAIVDTITNVTTFFRKHSDFITGFIIAIGSALMIYLLPALIRGGIAAWAMMSPFLLIGGIIVGIAAAFALLYDDIMNFRDGNNSMIGEIFKKYPLVEHVVMGVIDTFKMFGGVIVSIFKLFVDLIKDPMNAWNNFKESVLAGIEDIRKYFPFLFGLADELGQAFGKMSDVVVGIWERIKAIILDTINSIKGKIGEVMDFFGFGDVKVEANKQISAAQNTPLNNVNSNAISNSQNVSKTSNVTVQKVEVHTQATNAEEISKSVGNTLKDELKRATSNFDDGVAS